MLPFLARRKNLIGILLSSSVFLFIISPVVFAQDATTQDPSFIQGQIDNDNQQIADLNGRVDSLKGELNKYLGNKDSLSSNYNQIQSSINTIQNSLTQEQTLISQLTQLVAQQESEMQGLKQIRDQRQQELYMSLQSSPVALLFAAKDFETFSYNYVLSESAIKESMNSISLINAQLAQTYTNKQKQEEEVQQLSSQLANLNQIKGTLATQLASVQSNINATSSSISAYGQQIASLNAQVNTLNQRLQEIILSKQKQATAVAYTGSNGFTFYSKGFGTYVGMPQYGARGMALKGFKAEQIASHYYTGTSVISSAGVDNRQITIKGYGTMSMKNYLAGIGEMISTWPVEALKAQIIVSRTYALYALNNNPPGIAFPADTSFQSYIGGTAKMQYVEETENEIISNNNRDPIEAFFFSSSGDHTESPSCVWFDCNASSAYNNQYSYLQGVVDEYDTPDIDPYALQENVAMSPQQATNIINTALLLCVGVQNCSMGNNVYSKYSTTINADLGINDNASGGFPNVENALRAAGITPVTNLQTITVNYIGDANIVTNLVIKGDGYKQGVTIDGGVFLLAFNLVSPGRDALWGMRYYIK